MDDFVLSLVLGLAALGLFTVGAGAHYYLQEIKCERTYNVYDCEYVSEWVVNEDDI